MCELPRQVLVSLLLCTAACRKGADRIHHDQPTPLVLTLEQCEIIKVAERFVSENGYTIGSSNKGPIAD
jgi:hypothetical protein